MSVSQKCQYALRAIFELTKRDGSVPVTVADIAAAQDVPRRFLEAILVQLKKAGFVESRRGMRGGYLLAVSPRTLSVGQIIRCVDGPVSPAKRQPGGGEYLPSGSTALLPLWERARKAVDEIFDSTTLQDLVEQEQLTGETYVGSNI